MKLSSIAIIRGKTGAALRPACNRLLGRDDSGQAMVEMAYVAPILLLLTVGIFMFGTALNKYLVLNNAVEVGGQLLADERGEAADPCAAATTAIENAAPNLSLANSNFTYTINGASYPNTNSCSGITLQAGWNATVSVTYPVSFYVIWFGSESYTLTASVEEIVQ
jgi:Flp pilus assembly protein TadG